MLQGTLRRSCWRSCSVLCSRSSTASRSQGQESCGNGGQAVLADIRDKKLDKVAEMNSPLRLPECAFLLDMFVVQRCLLYTLTSTTSAAVRLSLTESRCTPLRFRKCEVESVLFAASCSVAARAGLIDILHALGYKRPMSISSFTKPHFELMADILLWLVKRYRLSQITLRTH